MRTREPRLTHESPLNRLNGSIIVPSPTRNLPQPMTRLGPMIVSSEMSFPSMRSAHVFSDEFGSSHAKSDNQGLGRLLDAITISASLQLKTDVDAGLSLWGWVLNRGLPFVARDEWPLPWWWPLDTCLRGCRPPRRC